MTRLSKLDSLQYERVLDPAVVSDIRASCALPRGVTDVAVEIINRDGVAIASLSGAVDVLTVPAFSLALKHLLVQPLPCVVVDLSGIDFFGAVALRELINFGQAVSKPGISWAVVGSHAVLRPLQVLGAFDGLPVCGSVHSAMAHVLAK